MRTVAIILVLSTLLLVAPAYARNECNSTPNTSTGQTCVEIAAGKPASPNPVPALPNSGLWGKYYAFFPGTACTVPTSEACRGTPASNGSGIPSPIEGGSPTRIAATFGLLFQESNGLGGLQRVGMSLGQFYPADHMVLV